MEVVRLSSNVLNDSTPSTIGRVLTVTVIVLQQSFGVFVAILFVCYSWTSGKLTSSLSQPLLSSDHSTRSHLFDTSNTGHHHQQQQICIDDVHVSYTGNVSLKDVDTVCVDIINNQHLSSSVQHPNDCYTPSDIHSNIDSEASFRLRFGLLTPAANECTPGLATPCTPYIPSHGGENYNERAEMNIYSTPKRNSSSIIVRWSDMLERTLYFMISVCNENWNCKASNTLWF